MEDNEEEKKRNDFSYKKLCRCYFRILVPLLCTIFLLLYSVGFWLNPISVPSQCKIVSSNVDLRSSKVCEMSLLSYKAKHVFYPFERNSYRCRDDYYWASIFKVEYIDHLGQLQLEWAEAPDQALPSHCRPSFNVALLTKNKFQVNETYDCWYALGISRVNMYQDDFSDCQAKYSSTADLLDRYFILLLKLANGWDGLWGLSNLTTAFKFEVSGSRRMLKNARIPRMLKSVASRSSLRHWRWDVISGAVAGFSTSLLLFPLIRFLNRVKNCFHQLCASRLFQLRRICFFIAYFSFMGFLMVQYLQRVGFIEIP